MCMLTLLHSVAACTLKLSISKEPVFILQNDIDELVPSVVLHQNVTSLHVTRTKTDLINGTARNYMNSIFYDHGCSKDCMMSHWFGPIPHFPDTICAQTFHIKQGMAETVINNFAKEDPF